MILGLICVSGYVFRKCGSPRRAGKKTSEIVGSPFWGDQIDFTMVVIIPTSNSIQQTHQMNLNTSPFEGPRARNIAFRDTGPENKL